MYKIEFSDEYAKMGYTAIKPHQKKRLLGFLNRNCMSWISKQGSVIIKTVAESGDNNSYLIVIVQTPFPQEPLMYLAMRKSKYPGAVMTFGRTTNNLWPLIREQRGDNLVYTLPYGGIKRTCGSRGGAPIWKEVIESALTETLEEGGCVITEQSRSRVLQCHMVDHLSYDNTIWILSDLVCAISVDHLQYVQTQPEDDELLSVQLVSFPTFVRTVYEHSEYRPDDDGPIPRDFSLSLTVHEWYEWGQLFASDPEWTREHLSQLTEILKTRYAPNRSHTIALPEVTSLSGEILRPKTTLTHQFQVEKGFPHYGYNSYMNETPATILLVEMFRENPERTLVELKEISQIPSHARLIPKQWLAEIKKKRDSTK